MDNATDNRKAVTEQPLTRRSISLRVADFTDLEPVDKAEFAAEMSPILALTSPVGMTRADRNAWLSAAYRALAGIPVGLLRRGVEAAMLRVDHPAKIVPAIVEEIDRAWKARKANAPSEVIAKPIALPAPVETEEQREERLAVKQMMADLAAKLSAKA